MFLYYLEGFLLILAFPGFESFLSKSIFKNLEATESCSLVFFKDVKTFHAIIKLLNHSVFLRERLESIAPSYQCKQRVES